jgi:DNA invertase Pin-like site-specific DNA recombinase
MEVALYMRVSTSRQQQHQTIEQQLSRLHAYVALQPDWHVADEHIYRDDGYSGATLKRPGLDRLRDRAAMAAFACVLMTAPDRFARNYVPQMLLVDELTRLGRLAEIRSTSGGLYAGSNSSKMSSHLRPRANSEATNRKSADHASRTIV